MKTIAKFAALGLLASSCGLGPYSESSRSRTADDGDPSFASTQADAEPGSTDVTVTGEGFDTIKRATASRIKDETGDKITIIFEGPTPITVTLRKSKNEGEFVSGVTYSDRAAGQKDGEVAASVDQYITMDNNGTPEVKPALGDVAFRLSADGKVSVDADGMTASPKLVYSFSGQNIPVKESPNIQ